MRLDFRISFDQIYHRNNCRVMEDHTIVAYGGRKTKKLICGMEGENVVAYGRLPSPLSIHMY